MPAAMTYDSLLDDLRAYIERGQSVDESVHNQLPRLINLAERDIATKLKILGLINVVSGSMSAGASVIAKPDRWRDTTGFSVAVDGKAVQLFPRSYEYCRMYWPDPSQRDSPEFYADYGYYHWLVVPTPADDYPMEITYWQLPALLDETNQTNWLTEYAPNALLNGSLLQCAPFLGHDERIPTWQGFYNEQLAALDGQDLQRIIDRSVARTEV